MIHTNIVPASCKHYHTIERHPACFSKPPKILTLDIETSPALIWAWDVYETNAIKVEKQWSILCIGYKWKGKKVKILYGKEKDIARKIRDLLDEADIVIGHNHKKFDLKKINTKILKYGIPPPSTYKTVDTLTNARKYLGLLSNKLGDIGEFYEIGEKIRTDKELWFDYMNGIKSRQRQMHRYCMNDVVLTEKWYDLLLPWLPALKLSIKKS